MTMHTTPLDSFEGANCADVVQAVPLINCVSESRVSKFTFKSNTGLFHKMQAGVPTPESIPPLE